jgi:phosphoglycolate phosphatase-like HAD superfamily hydrolase
VRDSIVAIIFDFDGVFVDSTELKHKAYLRVAEGLLEGSSMNLEKALANELIGSERGVVAKWFDRAFSLNVADEFIKTFAAYVAEGMKELTLDSAAAEMINFFKQQNISLSIVSAAPRSEIVKCLNDHGSIANQMDFIFGNEDGTKTDAIVKIGKHLKLDLNRVLFVGDMPSDFEAASKAGTKFVRITSFAGRMCVWPPTLNQSYSLRTFYSSFVKGKVICA